MDEQRDERVGEEAEERHSRNILCSRGAAWCTLDLPITPVAPAIAHWTPRPRKEVTWRDVEQILHDSGILHDREARDGREQDGG